MRGRGEPIPRLGLIALLSALVVAPSARAQVSASVSVASDYRLWGVSLTDRRPAASLNLDYNDLSGVYLGGSAIAEQTSRTGVEMLGHVEYLGLATHRDGGVSWDVGVRNQSTTLYADRRRELRYSDVYLGASRDDLSLYVHYYPDRISHSGSLVYVDLSGAIRRAQNWRLSGHVGVLTPLEGSGGQKGGRERYDLRLGVTREFRTCEITLGWTAASPKPRPTGLPSDGALLLGATFFF